jgi:drug/metabolite transporter (DMT)-like permease
VVILVAARAGGAPKVTDRRALPWFVATGFFNGSSLFLMYVALDQGQVSLVSPIVATYPLFTLALSMLLLRHERIAPRIALGAILTVAGVAVLLAF